MANFIVIAVLLIIVGAAVSYIIKEKKRGSVCIGCPHAGTCAKMRQGSCNCHSDVNLIQWIVSFSEAGKFPDIGNFPAFYNTGKGLFMQWKTDMLILRKCREKLAETWKR